MTVNNKTNLKMKKVIALLKLQDGADEGTVENAVLTVQNSLKTASEDLGKANGTIEDLKNQLTEAKNALQVVNEAAAAEFVKNCIKEGKISPEKEEEVLIQAKNNLEGFKSLMGAIPVKAANILNQIEVNAEVVGAENRTFRELEKQAPSVLNAMKKNDLKGYVNLYNTQYGTAKTEADFK